jgi:crotonobetainyl-CoA:carnitine CoA-transferase CaiB-like acyl-CoA transferase
MSEQQNKKPTGPLSGIRVVDMTSVLMGPYATQILADYGADVIKIEDESGDLLRMGGAMRNRGMGQLFLQCNRNKRSVVLDAKSEEGRAALLRMCEKADVFITNVRPAALSRLKLGYEDIKAHNPAIVYVSLVGYGQRGLYKARPAFDDLMQGISGISALIGRAQGVDPQFVPLNIADKIAGITAAHAILAALLHKERTGIGQAVEVPMFEILAQFVLSDHFGGYGFDPPIGPIGYNRLLSRTRRPYPTSDGFLAIVVYTNQHWKRFFELIGRPEECSANPLFHDHATRTRSYDDVHRFLAVEMKKKTTAEWQAAFDAHDIPWAAVNSIEELVEDPHLRSVNLVQTIDHPTEGRIRLVASPINFSETPSTLYRHPPSFGEHTAEVMAEFAPAAAAPVSASRD